MEHVLNSEPLGSNLAVFLLDWDVLSFSNPSSQSFLTALLVFMWIIFGATSAIAKFLELCSTASIFSELWQRVVNSGLWVSSVHMTSLSLSLKLSGLLVSCQISGRIKRQRDVRKFVPYLRTYPCDHTLQERWNFPESAGQNGQERLERICLLIQIKMRNMWSGLTSCLVILILMSNGTGLCLVWATQGEFITF